MGVSVAGEGTAEGLGMPSARALGPAHPGEGEAILWEGRPDSARRRLIELLLFLLLLGLLSWAAVGLIMPHFAGSAFAGSPDANALPLVLAMVVGTVSIIALPVWLRSSARGRSRYMLTNRRALVWLGNRIIGEVMLFGAELRVGDGTLAFRSSNMFLSWRLKDEGQDQLRFERIADADAVAALAEEHGARWLDRPDTPEG